MNYKSNRILELDYIRGFALLGIILTNIFSIFRLPLPKSYEDISYLQVINLFVENKFFAIFSFLFGVGFYIFIRNAKEKGLNANVLFLRRLFILAIFGILHQLLQPGEALLIYAVLGLLLIPCFYLNKYINLVMGLILLVIFLYIGSKTILPIPYFVLGLAAGQFNVFENIKTKVLVVMSVVSTIGFGISMYILSKAYVLPHYDLYGKEMTDHQLNEYVANQDAYTQLLIYTSPVIALFYVSVLLLVVRIRFFSNLLMPLRLYGRMALTNYVGQTLLIWLVILIIGRGSIGYLDTLWICIGIYIAQLLFTYVWLKCFKFGPFEYIWRMGTYWNIPKLKK